jgi:hypothetical protein
VPAAVPARQVPTPPEVATGAATIADFIYRHSGNILHFEQYQVGGNPQLSLSRVEDAPRHADAYVLPHHVIPVQGNQEGSGGVTVGAAAEEGSGVTGTRGIYAHLNIRGRSSIFIIHFYRRSWEPSHISRPTIAG